MQIELSSSVSVKFIPKANGPERLVCDAELVFAGGVLDGMKLCGFSLWRNVEGEVYVSFPARAFGPGTERRYFDYLRSTDATPGEARRVKEWILAEYRKANGLPTKDEARWDCAAIS